MPDVALLDQKIAEAEEMMAKAESGADKRKAKERKEDLLRLRRVELLYVRTGIMQIPTSSLAISANVIPRRR